MPPGCFQGTAAAAAVSVPAKCRAGPVKAGPCGLLTCPPSNATKWSSKCTQLGKEKHAGGGQKRRSRPKEVKWGADRALQAARWGPRARPPQLVEPAAGRGCKARVRPRGPRPPRRRLRPRDTKQRRGNPPHLQPGAPRAFENHRSALGTRARHSPGLPVPPGAAAAAAAAISSRCPSPSARCQVTPFTWARSHPRRAEPRLDPSPPAPAETAQRPARPHPTRPRPARGNGVARLGE